MLKLGIFFLVFLGFISTVMAFLPGDIVIPDELISSAYALGQYLGLWADVLPIVPLFEMLLLTILNRCVDWQII